MQYQFMEFLRTRLPMNRVKKIAFFVKRRQQYRDTTGNYEWNPVENLNRQISLRVSSVGFIRTGCKYARVCSLDSNYFDDFKILIPIQVEVLDIQRRYRPSL